MAAQSFCDKVPLRWASSSLVERICCIRDFNASAVASPPVAVASRGAVVESKEAVAGGSTCGDSMRTIWE